MVNMANILYKTVGIAGMSAVIYDTYATAKRYSSVEAERFSSDVYESTIAARHSNTNASYVTGAMQDKISNLRTNNPIIPFLGKIKGAVAGTLNGLADNIIPIALSSMALAGKGFMQKTGAWGLGIYGIYQIAREGFGIGKTTPIDK